MRVNMGGIRERISLDNLLALRSSLRYTSSRFTPQHIPGSLAMYAHNRRRFLLGTLGAAGLGVLLPDTALAFRRYRRPCLCTGPPRAAVGENVDICFPSQPENQRTQLRGSGWIYVWGTRAAHVRIFADSVKVTSTNDTTIWHPTMTLLDPGSDDDPAAAASWAYRFDGLPVSNSPPSSFPLSLQMDYKVTNNGTVQYFTASSAYFACTA
jgi:hypothetical protein